MRSVAHWRRWAYPADLIVVDGRPTADIDAIRSVELVVKGGEVLVEN